jgi:hypothetical protein
LRFVKGKLERDEIHLNIFVAPNSPKSIKLKIRKEKIKIPNNYLNNNLKSK